jgi:hypothetical protein
VQDLATQLSAMGLYTHAQLRVVTTQPRSPSARGFAAWADIPPVVAVTLVVPRRQVDGLFATSKPLCNVQASLQRPSLFATSKPGPDHASPCLQGALSSPAFHNLYSDTQLFFGTVATHGNRDEDGYVEIAAKATRTRRNCRCWPTTSFPTTITTAATDTARGAEGHRVMANLNMPNIRLDTLPVLDTSQKKANKRLPHDARLLHVQRARTQSPRCERRRWRRRR